MISNDSFLGGLVIDNFKFQILLTRNHYLLYLMGSELDGMSCKKPTEGVMCTE